jgi:NADH pyrophosphatase NudC (nudix superfamily)
MTSEGRRLRRAPGVLHAEVDGEEVLLNPETGIYHLVNRTGRSLIGWMEDGETLDEAVDRLAEESGEASTRVRADAAAFVSAMTERGLLVEADA